MLTRSHRFVVAAQAKRFVSTSTALAARGFAGADVADSDQAQQRATVPTGIKK